MFLILILVFVLSSTVYAAYAVLTQEEAEALFDSLGCKSCHREGGVADSWSEILSELREWGEEYNSIDDAVSEKVTYLGGVHFNTFDDLLEQMKNNVGASDEDIAKLKEFFISVFQGMNVTAPSKPGGGGIVSQSYSLEFMGIVIGVAAIIIITVAYLVSRMGGSGFMTDGGEETDALKFLSIYLFILIIAWIVIFIVLVSRGVISG